MERYVFSGTLTEQMIQYLQAIEEFEPMDVLVTQVDKSGVKKMLTLFDRGIVKSFLLDSGAFTHHRMGTPIDVDEYIDYANSLDEYCSGIAELDTIPGKFGEPKSKEDYIESSTKSWETYLYMRPKMKSPEKLIPVYHYGEPVSALKRMLEWRGPNGEKVEYLGLSPANDTHQKSKDAYLNEMNAIIAKSSNPNVKTHIFGMTALDSLSRIKCYSADSISHRLRSAYNKIFTRKWGTISLSDRVRSSKTKSNMSFFRLCDEDTYKEFEKFAAHYHFTIDQLKQESSARVAVDIVEIQQAIKAEYKYSDKNIVHKHKLIDLD